MYGTPGGLASLEAETVLLPGTSGLPGISPAPDRSEPEELAAWAARLGLEPCDLDDLIHDACSKQASEVNNGGLDAQVRFLAGSFGTATPGPLLSDLQLVAARRATPPGTGATAAGSEQRPPAPGQ